jgi:hypothetical protein
MTISSTLSDCRRDLQAYILLTVKLFWGFKLVQFMCCTYILHVHSALLKELPLAFVPPLVYILCLSV